MSHGPGRLFGVLLVALLASGASGCFRYHTHVPGVIDMRTDGSEAPPARTKVRDLEREAGFHLVLGRGIQRMPERRILVEERHYWLAGDIPLLNTSAREDVGLVLKRAPAWRNVVVTEEMSTLDGVAYNVIPVFIPLTGYVLPPFTFTYEAEPVDGGRAPVAPPPRHEARSQSRSKPRPKPRGDASSKPPPPPTDGEGAPAGLPPPPSLLDLEEAAP